MRRPTWVTRLFPARPTAPIRRTPAARPRLTQLEDRVTPTLQLTYGGAGTALSLAETSSGADTVTVTEPVAGTLRIDLGTANFDAGSSLTGVTYSTPGDPANSTFAEIDISTAGNVTTFTLNTGADADAIAFSMTNAAGGVGAVVIDGGAGADTLTVGATALGTFTASAEDISVTGALVTTGAIRLNGDTMTLGAAVNAGASTVTLSVNTSDREIDLGTSPSAGKLGLSQADLDQVTAGVLRIGTADTPPAASGAITVTAPITSAGTGWTTLSLLANGLTTRDITQTSGATLTVPNLFVLSPGLVSLTDPGNVVSQLSGIAAAVSFVTSTDLTLNDVDPAIGFSGLTAVAGPVQVTVLGVDNLLTVTNAVSATGGDVTLTADKMALNATVTAGAANTVTLRPTTAGTAIDLGSVVDTTAITLELSDAELDQITAGGVVVGSGTAGDLTVTTAITPATATRLELVTGGAILDGNAVGADLAVAALGLTAATGIGTGAGGPLDVLVLNLEASNATGDIAIGDFGAGLTVGGVSTGLAGVQVTGATGGVTLTSAGSVLVNVNGDRVVAPGNVGITTGGSIITGGDNLDLNGAVRSTGGDVTLVAGGNLSIGDTVGDLGGDVNAVGNIVLTAGNDVTVHKSFVDIFAGGTNSAITVSAGGAVSLQGSTGARLQTISGPVAVTAGVGAFSVSADSEVSGLGVTITADDVVLLGPVSAGAGTAVIAPVTALAPITLGTGALGLGISDAELDQLTAGVVQIGAATATGGISVDGNVTTHAGFDTLVLRTGGAVTALAGNSVAVTKLALDAATGVGTAVTPVATAVTSLAFNNTSGDVFVANTGPLTIAAVEGLTASSNTGGVTSISATSPVTFAVNTTTAGDTTYTAGETNDPGTFADDLTINAGVTVSVTGGSLTLQAGDEIILATGSTASASGTVTLDLGFGDLDGSGGGTIRGTIDAGTGTPTATAGAATTALVVDFFGGATLPDGLSFQGGTGADSLTLTDAGSAAPHTYAITGTGVTRDGATTVSITAAVEGVTVTGGDLGDTFTVTPALVTAFAIDGGAPTPPAAPGDTLTVDTTGTTGAFLTLAAGPTGFFGTYTFADRGNVTFQQIETLDAAVDFTITKTDGAATEVPGTTVTYTVTVSNVGTLGVGGVAVADLFPAILTNVTFTSVAAGGATGNTASGTGNLAETLSLPVGSSVTYTITADIDPNATGTLVNTATVTAPVGTVDPTPGNNSATDTDTLVPSADVAVTKTNGGTTEVPGTSTTYTIVVSNAGPSTAVGVSVADTFPAALTNVSFMSVAAGGATGNTSGSGNIADTVTLPPGASITYTVTADINPAATGTLSNTATATVAMGTTDTDPTNDSATDTDTLTPTVDVSVTKTNGVLTSTPGTSTTYTIVVSNTGPSTAAGVTLADAFPAALTNVSFTSVAAGGATGNASGSGNLSETLTLPPGASVTYTVTADIDPAATGVLSNTATATIPAGTTDTDPTNDSATDTDTLTPEADVAVTKTNGVAASVPGTSTTYTITVTNAGPSTAVGVTLADTFPAALTNVTFTSTAAGGATGNTSGSGNLNETLTLPPGASVTYTVLADIDPAATGTLANTATATVAIDPIPGNNTATDTDTLTPTVDVAITKDDGATTEIPGTGITYTIVVSNTGPSTAAGVSVADAFPAALTSVTFTSAVTGGATGNTSGSGNISDTVTLPPGATITYTVLATIDPAATGSLSNTATATVAMGTTDTDPTNNSATDTNTLIPTVDVSVTKDDGATTEIPGTPVTYTIVVSNTGPSTAAGVTLADTFPAALTNVTFTSVAAGGATGNTSGSGNLSETLTLPPGASVTYTVTADIDPAATGTLVNTATATIPAGTTDTDPTNDSATDTNTLVPTVDVAVTKTDGATTEIPGTTVTYTVVVSNTGPSTAAGVSVADTFPGILSGVTFTSVGAGGATGNTSGSGNIADTVTLPPNSSITYTITGTIDPAATGTLVNTATATVAMGTTDTNPANNSATDTNTLVPTVDVAVTKTDGATTEIPGTSVTYTVVISNTGPSTAAGVTLTDAFPASLSGVTFTSAGAGGATGNTASGSGNILDTVTLPPGASVTYTVTGTIDPAATGTLANTAAATIPAGTTDTNAANDSATDTNTLVPTADLSVTLAAGPAGVRAGDQLVFTAIVTNAGPSTATGVTLTDVLPAGVTYASSTTSQGTVGESGGTVTAAIGTLAPGASATVTITVVPTLAGDVTNTVTVTSAATDPTPADATATVTVSVDLPLTGRLTVGGAADGSVRVLVPTGTGTYNPTPTSVSVFGNTGTPTRAAAGDVDGDGFEDTVLATGPGVGFLVAVVSGRDGSMLVAPFNPFGGAFSGGGFVAAGDLDGDGRDEFVVTPDEGGGGRVVVYSLGATADAPTRRASFLGIDDAAFRGGARVALGDVNADGTPDLIVTAGFGGGPRAAVFDGATVLGTPTRLVNDFFAFPGADAVNLRNGAFVAAGDVDGDGFADLIFGGGPGGASRVFILSGALVTAGDVAGAQAAPVANFFVAGNSATRGGVRVAAKDMDGDTRADVVVGSGEGEPSRVRVYPGATFTSPSEPTGFQDLDPFGGVLTDGVFVG